MGRPGKASAALARKIAAKIKAGTRMADAAESEGIDRSSLFNYLDKDHSSYSPEFAGIINAALAAGKKPKQAG